MLSVRPCLYSELQASSGFSELVAEYAAESAIPGMPAPNTDHATYILWSEAGASQWFGAWDGEYVIGLLNLIVGPLPHYSQIVATTESYFVLADCRDTGAGDLLRQEAERHAVACGAVGLLMSAPAGGKLDRVLSLSRAQCASHVYFRALK